MLSLAKKIQILSALFTLALSINQLILPAIEVSKNSSLIDLIRAGIDNGNNLIKLKEGATVLVKDTVKNKRISTLGLKQVITSLATFGVTLPNVELFNGDLILRDVLIQGPPAPFKENYGITLNGKITIKGFDLELAIVIVEKDAIALEVVQDTPNKQQSIDPLDIFSEAREQLFQEASNPTEIMSANTAQVKNRPNTKLAKKQSSIESNMTDQESSPIGNTKNPSQIGVSFMLSLPQQVSFSAITNNQYPQWNNVLDKLYLPSGKIIISNFDYIQPLTAALGFEDQLKAGTTRPEFEREYNRFAMIDVKSGVNFIAQLSLEGPFQLLGEIVRAGIQKIGEKTKLNLPANALILQAAQATIHGAISKGLQNSFLAADIPIFFGADLTKIPQIPKTVSNAVQIISTTGFYGKIEQNTTDMGGKQFKMLIGTGARLVLGGQKDPLILNFEGSLSPDEMTVSAYTDSTIHLPWLDIGNIGLQLAWDLKLAAEAMAVGIPFTGLGIRGAMRIGKAIEASTGSISGQPITKSAQTTNKIDCQLPTQESEKTTIGDTIICLTAGAKVKSGGSTGGLSFGELVFDGLATNIDFKDFIGVLAQIAKKDISTNAIPTMNLRKAQIYVVSEDTSVAGKKYTKGIEVTADGQLGPIDGGIHFAIIQPTESIKILQGNGHLKTIDLTISGQQIFKLSGIGTEGKYGPQTTEKLFAGPEIDVYISNDSYTPNRFLLHGQLDVPGLGFSHKVDLHYNGRASWSGELTTTLGNLMTAYISANFNLENLEQLALEFEFKQGFTEALVKFINEGFNQINSNAQASLQKVDQSITEVQNDIVKAQQQFYGKAQEEANRVSRRITEVEQDLARYTRDCDATPWWKKGFTDSCYNVAGTQIELAATRDIYRNAILKAGTTVVGGTLDVSQQLTGKIKDLQALQTVTRKTLELTSSALQLISKGALRVQVKNAAGIVTGTMLKESKLPLLKELKIEIYGEPLFSSRTITLTNVQFDFKDPAKSAQAIAGQILTQLKALLGI